METVAIIGRSISANLAAAYIKQQQPDLNVLLIGQDKVELPIVGESLIEMTTHFLFDLGLAGYLEQRQFHKYGLTFYFKEDITNPNDRTYAVHEAPAGPAHPSFQLNRFTFKICLQELNQQLGVKTIDAKVKQVDTEGYCQHNVIYQQDNNISSLEANWVIDATGRRRLLARQYNLNQKPPTQRCVFWFRLKDFDREFVKKINSVKKPQYAFDSFFATHHFFGKGNWIWCIPLKQDEEALLSVGITWRPDIYPHHVTSMEDFCKYVALEHPVVAELVKSGTVLDENRYYNYLYETKQVYSPDGWFIIGDAGNTVDPLYSVGLATTSVQVHQVEAMIAKGRKSKLDPQYVNDLEVCYRTIFHTVQDDVTRQYESMHDPYEAHLRMHLITGLYFYFILPCWLAKYHTDTVGARFIAKIANSAADDYKALTDLLPIGSKCLGPLPSSALYNYYVVVLNFKLWGGNAKEIARHMSRMLRMFAGFRWKLLRNANWHQWSKHVRIIVADWLKSYVLRYLFRDKALHESKLIQLFVKKPTKFMLRKAAQDEPETMMAPEDTSEIIKDI